MINTEVKNAIETIVKFDVTGEEFPYKELDLAIVNCDYYVRFGASRKAFMSWFYCINYGKLPVELIVDNIPKEEQIPYILVGLVKAFFDKAYFEECCKSPISRMDCSIVRKMLKNFNTKELKNFFTLLINGRVLGDLFVSNASSVRLWSAFNNECCNVDNSIPQINETPMAYSAFTHNNPSYFFDCLSPKKIVDIICDSIDKNADVAEKLAKILNDSGYKSAERYLNNVVTRVA